MLRHGKGWWRHPAIDAGFVGIMELPRDSIEDPSEAVLGDAAAEERICGESAESVVADLGVSRRGTLTNQVKVGVGAKRRDIQED